jgi:hypothetical protein
MTEQERLDSNIREANKHGRWVKTFGKKNNKTGYYRRWVPWEKGDNKSDIENLEDISFDDADFSE